MSNSLEAAIQTFIRAHRLPIKNLASFESIKPGDYDALYAKLACILPEIPAELHQPLYEIATAIFTPIPDFTTLREVCNKYLVEPSKPLPKLEYTPLSPVSDASNHQPEPVPTPELSENEEDEEEYTYPSSTSNDRFEPPLTRIPFQESSKWNVDNSAFVRPKSCHRSLLYHAGYFPFERNFGVPYFATEAPTDSHRLHDDAPLNADVQKHREEGTVDIATLVDAHRPWRRRWSPREVSLLKELVARRAGGKRGDNRFVESIECRKTAASWSVDVWDSLAVQAGRRLSGRPGHALMCRFLNGSHDEWQDGEDAFLRDDTAVNACLRDVDGGWDVVGAAVKRPGMACLRRWEEIHARKKSDWSPTDDSRLRKAVSAVGPQWSSVALVMGDRTGPQCMHRYVKQLSGKRAGKWSAEEIQKLQEAVKAVGNDWIEIAKRVETRNDVQCREKWVCGLDPEVKHSPWEKDEDDLLRHAVEKFGNKEWESVANLIPERNETQCRRRMAILENQQKQVRNQQKEEGQVKKRGRSKAGRWSREELENLREAVGELENDWENIAIRVGTREEKQCREKWAALLQTGLADADAATQSGNKAGRWAKEEVKQLLEAVEQLGQSWTEVGKMVGSRDEAQCREKWISLQHGQNEKAWNRVGDEVLRADVEAGKIDGTEPDWQAISEKLGRDQVSCKRRYEVIEQRARKKRPSDDTLDEGTSNKRRKQGRWSLEETRLLKSGLELHGQDFDAIAEMVKTRNESQCRDKWYAMLNAAAIDATWTAAEDEALIQSIEQNGLSWETIGESMTGRSVPQCRKRWKVLREQGRSARLGRWKPAEVASLRAAYKEFREDWAKVAERVGSRNDWQCRQKIGLGWRTRDDEMLYDAVRQTGKKWKEVKKLMSGFSEVMCKRRWKELEGGKKDVKAPVTSVAKEESIKKEDMMRVADVVRSVAENIVRNEEHINAEDVMKIEDYHADAVATVQELVVEDPGLESGSEDSVMME